MSSPQPSTTKFIAPEALKDLLQNPEKKPGVDYLVVDVRGESFKAGHLPNAKNVPTDEFLDTVTKYVDEFQPVKTVIFHCAKSEVRGPKCANKYHDALALKDPSRKQEVLTLRGGFLEWQSRFQDSPDLVVNDAA
ncbi:hypothetical protein HK102_001868 [Quaeritorhiza haematococci]|nr:hypothetical protein HK102_001868 [Quaeritorhiza haematococci]